MSGTNRDLAAEVAAGRFREDLFSRINLWTYRLPGLAELREDIAPNLDFELARFAEAEGRSVRFNKEGRETFLKLACDPGEPWSGNFRELRAVVTRLATLADNGRIGAPSVAREFARLKQNRKPVTRGSDDESLLRDLLGYSGYAALDRFDAVQLAEVVRVCRTCPHSRRSRSPVVRRLPREKKQGERLRSSS